MYNINVILILTLVSIVFQTNSAHVIQKQNENRNATIQQMNIAFMIFPSNINGTPIAINSIKGVMKFPPFLEYFVQRIQKFFSNYVHEDFSRPPPYDSPNFDGNSLLLNPQNEKNYDNMTEADGLPKKEVINEVNIIRV